MQRWYVIQHELLPEFAEQCGPLTTKLEKVTIGNPKATQRSNRGLVGCTNLLSKGSGCAGGLGLSTGIGIGTGRSACRCCRPAM
jgi:hypothetical protein